VPKRKLGFAQNEFDSRSRMSWKGYPPSIAIDLGYLSVRPNLGNHTCPGAHDSVNGYTIQVCDLAKLSP
jgi:hypothetical protein